MCLETSIRVVYGFDAFEGVWRKHYYIDEIPHSQATSAVHRHPAASSEACGA